MWRSSLGAVVHDSSKPVRPVTKIPDSEMIIIGMGPLPMHPAEGRWTELMSSDMPENVGSVTESQGSVTSDKGSVTKQERYRAKNPEKTRADAAERQRRRRAR